MRQRLPALSGFAIGGLTPSAAARVAAPMIAASLAAVTSYRGVFVGAALVYAGIAVAALLVVRAGGRRATTLQQAGTPR